MLDTYLLLFSIINNSVVLGSWLDLKAETPISKQEGKIQNVNIENTVWSGTNSLTYCKK